MRRKKVVLVEKYAREMQGIDIIFCDLGNDFCVCAIFRRKRERRWMVLAEGTLLERQIPFA